jgi:hypothetical protein
VVQLSPLYVVRLSPELKYFMLLRPDLKYLEQPSPVLKYVVHLCRYVLQLSSKLKYVVQVRPAGHRSLRKYVLVTNIKLNCYIILVSRPKKDCWLLKNRITHSSGT